jgi:hypothetical protein
MKLEEAVVETLQWKRRRARFVFMVIPVLIMLFVWLERETRDSCTNTICELRRTLVQRHHTDPLTHFATVNVDCNLIP